MWASHCPPCKSALQPTYKSTQAVVESTAQLKTCGPPRAHLFHSLAVSCQHPRRRCPGAHSGLCGWPWASFPSKRTQDPHTCLSGLPAMKRVISSPQIWEWPSGSRSAAGPGSASSERTRPKTPLNSVQQVKAALRLLHGEQQGLGLALTPAPCKFMVSQGHQHHQQWIAPTFKGASSWPPKVCEKDKAGWVHFSV